MLHGFFACLDQSTCLVFRHNKPHLRIADHKIIKRLLPHQKRAHLLSRNQIYRQRFVICKCFIPIDLNRLLRIAVKCSFNRLCLGIDLRNLSIRDLNIRHTSIITRCTLIRHIIFSLIQHDQLLFLILIQIGITERAGE